MAKRKLTLDDRIGAIIARDEGMPYPEVLETFELTPNQFARAITRELESYIILTEGKGRKILEEIASDPERIKELFNMGEEFVKEQYDKIQGRIPGESQKSFYFGTHFHPKNTNAIVYHALTSHNPNLSSHKREEVIEGIKGLPSNLQNYLHNLRLGGLMVSAFDKEKQDSPLAVLEVFDKIYQDKTGDTSLFDLSQEEHLHKWGDKFSAPKSYWQSPSNVEEAVYHILTEKHPELASHKRIEVIERIKNLPNNLKRYLQNLGLYGLMMNAFEKGKKDSPLAILEIFDKVYQEKTKDASLFDLNQESHLHKWGDNFKAPNSYWQNPTNVKEAVYHTLTEYNPTLKSTKREEVIEGVKNLPNNLKRYLQNLGLYGLMLKAFDKGKKGSPLAVLEVFNKVYQDKTGDASLFDDTQKNYLEIYSKNRIVKE